MKKNKMVEIIVCVVLLIMMAVNAILPINAASENAVNQYKCNCKAVSLTTKINSIDQNGVETKIEGERFVLSKFEDPLTMYNADGKVICFGDDDYDFITQNNHAIMKNKNCICSMEGQFSFFGDNYIIYDGEGNEIAKAEFNFLGTKGELRANDGTLIAQYNSRFARKDYVVTIFEENTVDVDAIQMIFASYASDSVADSSN